MSKNDLKTLDIGIGDDTFCVGRYIGHEGIRHNLPVVRFGNIAMMPLEPINVNKAPQNCFLIESRIMQGYSGSPVFVKLPPWELREYHDGTARRRLYGNLENWKWNFPMTALSYVGLLAIVVAFVPDELNTKFGNTGMMAAVPAWELLELLNYDNLRDQRRVEAEELKRKGGFDMRRGEPA